MDGCGGKLTLDQGDFQSGRLACKKCSVHFPILAGVAIVLPHADDYILAHAKGIAQWVDDGEIPKSIRKNYLAAKRGFEREHIEEDLESERVNALYFMTHFLSAGEASAGVESPEIRQMMATVWDRGPFAQVAEWVTRAGGKKVIELGCGVGGLASRLPVSEYLGVDSSFASVALARFLYLGEGKDRKTQRLPSDLWLGPLAREFDLGALRKRLKKPEQIDFVVGDLEHPPVVHSFYDGSVVLNAIDMLREPAQLPAIQKSLIREGGFVIQCAPYIWHDSVISGLRSKMKGVKDSAEAVESLYIKEGFTIESRANHIPWLFFKHLRQVELYSVHGLMARLNPSRQSR